MGRKPEETISRALSAAIGQLKDPRVPLVVTIEAVNLNKDFSQARVYVSCLGDVERLLEALDSAKGFLHRELAQRLDLRRVPQLEFIDGQNRIF